MSLKHKTHFEHVWNIYHTAFGKDFISVIENHPVAMAHNKDMLLNYDEFDKIFPTIVDRDAFETEKKYLLSQQIFRMLYNFHHAGKKVFKFTEDLCHLLLLTELKQVPVNMLKAPFHTFYLVMPHYPILVKDNFKIEALYISLKEPSYYDFTKESECVNKPITKYLSVLTIGQYNEKIEEYSYLMNWPLYLEEGDVHDQVQTAIKDLEKDGNDALFYNKLFTFVLNALLYLASDKAYMQQIVPQKKRATRKGKRKNKAGGNRLPFVMPYFYVGKEIVIDQKTRETFRSEHGNTKRKLRGRWVVRGHWRNQACGEGFSERKLVWIHPYMKGTDIGEEIHREYKLH